MWQTLFGLIVVGIIFAVRHYTWESRVSKLPFAEYALSPDLSPEERQTVRRLVGQVRHKYDGDLQRRRQGLAESDSRATYRPACLDGRERESQARQRMALVGAGDRGDFPSE